MVEKWKESYIDITSGRVFFIFRKQYLLSEFQHFCFTMSYFLYIIFHISQVVDNEVVKYIPPEKFYPVVSPKPPLQVKRRHGCLVVGAESIDPQLVCN